MKSSLIGGVALSALLALGLAGVAYAQDAAPDAPPADAPVAQMSPEQMQQQIDEMQQELSFVKQVQAEQVAGTANQLSDTSIKWDGASRTTDGAGDMFKVRGRILFDAVEENVDRKNGIHDYSARNIRGRQAYLGVEGQIGPKWAYKLEGGFVNGATPNWDDAVIEYKATPNTSVLFGNQKSLSLENITSQRFTTFLDRGPFNNVLDIDYHLGVGVVTTGTNYAIWGAVLGNSLNSPDVTAPAYGGNNADERIEATIRGVYQPILTDDDKVHTALWYRYRDRSGETGFTYAARPNTNYNSETTTGTQLQSTGAVGQSDSSFGGEFAWVHHNYSIQAEAADIHVDRIKTSKSATLGGPSFDIPTAYAFVSWFPTGETRNYNPNGQFGRVKVLNPVDKGGHGAFELAARYDFVDLTDMKANGVSTLAAQLGGGAGPIGTVNAPTAGLATAGVYNAGTLGVNWYPISYVRFMINYTYGKLQNRAFFNAVGAKSAVANNDADVSVLQARAQLDF